MSCHAWLMFCTSRLPLPLPTYFLHPIPPPLHCSDSDLALAASALHLCCAILAHKTAGTDAVAVMTLKVLPQALLLVRSPLLQGSALQVSAWR